jgi:hypothetical protein
VLAVKPKPLRGRLRRGLTAARGPGLWLTMSFAARTRPFRPGRSAKLMDATSPRRRDSEPKGRGGAGSADRVIVCLAERGAKGIRSQGCARSPSRRPHPALRATPGSIARGQALLPHRASEDARLSTGFCGRRVALSSHSFRVRIASKQSMTGRRRSRQAPPFSAKRGRWPEGPDAVWKAGLD